MIFCLLKPVFEAAQEVARRTTTPHLQDNLEQLGGRDDFPLAVLLTAKRELAHGERRGEVVGAAASEERLCASADHVVQGNKDVFPVVYRPLRQGA